MRKTLWAVLERGGKENEADVIGSWDGGNTWEVVCSGKFHNCREIVEMHREKTERNAVKLAETLKQIGPVDYKEDIGDA